MSAVNLKETLAFMLELTMRTFTMVYMIATELMPRDNVNAHAYFASCADWFEQQIRETETQQMINELYNNDSRL